MDKRKRISRQIPITLGNFASKRDITERQDRKSFPPCPPQPVKYRRSGVLGPNGPKVVYFTKHVSLSKMYKPDKDITYMDQIFAKSKKIGEGSFGEVYKVLSREDGKVYAIKQLKLSRHRRYGFAEVRNYEKVGDHLNCVKHLMAWEESGIIYIQMEYCQLSLAQYSNLTSDFPQSQLIEILHDMLQALDFLHKKNLIHLDVKPGNIMISKGIYKLADFGLLVDLNEKDGKRISAISDGDAKYLALEVLSKIYTFACDIFSLGISIVELAGNIDLPEFGPLWTQIRSGKLPNEFQNAVSPEFAKIISEMLMVHTKRPAACKILGYPLLKQVSKNDKIHPRRNYGVIVDEPLDAFVYNSLDSENNNIIETPRRPIHEVPNGWNCGHSGGDPHTPEYYKRLTDNSPACVRRKGLSRTRLIF